MASAISSLPSNLLSYLPLMRATMCRPHPYALPAPVATEVLRPALRQKTIPHLDDVLEDFGERSLLSVIVQLNYYFTLRAPG